MGIVKKEKYEKSIKLLCGIPGIGLIGAITILTELGNTNRFRNCDRLCVLMSWPQHSSGKEILKWR